MEEKRRPDALGRIGLASRCGGGGGRPDPFGVPHSSVSQPARRKVQVVAPGRMVGLSDYEEQQPLYEGWLRPKERVKAPSAVPLQIIRTR